jgi:hypothetical protein
MIRIFLPLPITSTLSNSGESMMYASLEAIDQIETHGA